MKKAIIVFLLFGLNFSLFGQKNVVIEKFTNLYCGVCPDRSILLTDLEQSYPHLIWISSYSPSFFEYNPMPYPGAEEMWDDCGISGTPLAMVGRVPYNNALGSSSSSWETRIQQQEDLEDYVDIEFSDIAFEEGSRNLTFDVTIQFHTLPTNTENFRVLLFVTEDDVIWRQHSYFNNSAGHPLEGLGDVIQDYSHQNVLRKMLSGNWGEENSIPDNPVVGEDYVINFSYQVPQEYHHLNMELTAAVSQHDETDVKNRPILNAERVQLSDFIISSTNEPDVVKFNAFPNPTEGVINLQFQKLPSQVVLMDAIGNQIQQYIFEDLNAQIDLRNMPSGNYLLQVFDGDQTISQKIIIH